MNYRTLGRTGFRVSEIGLGGGGLEKKTPEQVRAIVDEALSLGINFIDLFNSQPELRDGVGAAIAGRRDEVIIEGHLCTAMKDGQYQRTRDIAEVRKYFEDLLKRLNTDYIDVGMIHYIDVENDFDAVFNGPVIEYAKELKAAGTIRATGMSCHNPTVALKAAKTGLIDVILFSINPAYDMLPAYDDVDVLFKGETYAGKTFSGIDPARDLFYKTCEAEGVAITVMKAYGGGDLLDEKLSPLGKALTPVQCLHYALSRPAVACVPAGCASSEEVRTAVAYATATAEEKDYSAVLAGTESFGFAGKCVYCGHCQPCPMDIDIATVGKYYDLASTRLEHEGAMPNTVSDHYSLLSSHAGDCIKCGNCESNCPFGVAIMERMEKATTLFGK